MTQILRGTASAGLATLPVCGTTVSTFQVLQPIECFLWCYSDDESGKMLMWPFYVQFDYTHYPYNLQERVVVKQKGNRSLSIHIACRERMANSLFFAGDAHSLIHHYRAKTKPCTRSIIIVKPTWLDASTVDDAEGCWFDVVCVIWLVSDEKRSLSTRNRFPSFVIVPSSDRESDERK